MEPIYIDHRAHHSIYRKGMFSADSKSRKRFGNLSVCLEHNFILALPLLFILVFINQTFAVVLFLFSILHYKLFNQLHSAMHLRNRCPWIPEWYRKICLWNHYMHHQHPNLFFCVVMPGADYLFGTVCRMTEADKKGWEQVEKACFVERDQESIDNANFCKIPAFFREIKHNSTDGNLPPVPVEEDWNLGQKISRVVCKIWLGQVYICGSVPDKPVLVCANHISWLDPFILVLLARRPIRLMAHEQVLRFNPAVGWFFTKFLGAFPARTGKAVDASVKLLKEGQTVVMCPSGYAKMNGVEDEFKTGAIRIARAAEVPIIPVSIAYKNYPGNWILKLPFTLQCVVTCLFFLFRGPAWITIGQEVKDLPEDVKEASKKLKEEVLGCFRLP